ncbi:aminopeptidase Y [Xylaria bambusicola]|uniref:aminopeptidase Y n=1 Tax=Xylaria bambusicola TaxID=326684 RepID=UPI0020077A6B|nr:aminopeptidase Y [Xylaria bambusicola]KAI0523653.1 aminopeptidase Y [Xylaria bambusicola]
MKSFEVLAFAALFAAPGLATDNVLTPEGLVEKIKTAELERNLWNLDRIGKENGGHRAFGSPGYKASSDYILERAKTRFGPEYDTTVQEFDHLYNEVREISVTGPNGESVATVTLIYNPGTDDGPIKAPLIDTPVDDERGSACFEDQWEGIDATGKIALIKRGSCALSDKLKLARAHGASGALIYHNLAGTPSSATLGAENYGLLVPVAVIPLSVGSAWKEKLAANEEVIVELYIDAIFEERTSWNIIAETKQGDPNSVIMLGAHLDSVQTGPGVNDDGSGTSALLEIMTELRYYEGYPNKVRFAWWGAEESGLIGSLHYTESLTPEEADQIKFYFNYDMVGSPYPNYEIYIGDNEGDEAGASLLMQYLTDAGKEPYYVNFGTSSDYVGFVELGIPSSGIFTGASAATDPCYHLACDTLSNVNLDALTVNAKAAANAAAKLALSLDGVPVRRNVSLNPRSKDGARAQFLKWKRAAATAATQKSCSHRVDNTI